MFFRRSKCTYINSLKVSGRKKKKEVKEVFRMKFTWERQLPSILFTVFTAVRCFEMLQMVIMGVT